MADVEATGDSAAARLRGNDLYRKGRFAQAQKAYGEAARLAPEDSAPCSNMSAISFELGDYTAALANLEKALALSSSEPDDGPKKQKLYTRMAKCQFHLLALDDAGAAAEHLGAEDEYGQSLRRAIDDTRKLWAETPGRGGPPKAGPRPPAQIQEPPDAPEYYAVGHDEPESLLDPEIEAAVSSNGGDVAFFLAGSGDARYLFVNFMSLFKWEMGGARKFAKAQFTLVDINPAALARTLVMFDMIFVYTIFKSQGLPRLEDALTVLESVRALIDEFEKDKDLPGTNVLDMFWLSKATRDQVLRKLRHWAAPLGQDYTAERLRAPLAEGFRRTRAQMEATMGGVRDAPSGGQQNVKDFRELGVVFGPKAFLERREPELLPLIAAYRTSRGRATAAAKAKKALEAYIDAHWKVNMTMLDMDYESRRLTEAAPGTDPTSLLPNLTEDPNDIGRWAGVLGDLAVFFDMLAVSTVSLLHRVQVELIAGEMADVMERIRFDALEERYAAPVWAPAPAPARRGRRPAVDPSRFPRAYDRIHMSNIPDYVGGPLTTHMYAGPLLRADRPSNLRFNNLLNPPMFSDHDQFLAEYLLMRDERQIADHFGLARQQSPEARREAELMARLTQAQLGAGLGFAAEDYFIWARAGGRRVPCQRRMSRAALEHWRHAHLLKICLPHPRPLWSDRPVHAPLDLTALLRLVALLHGVGYPAHWLSRVLEAAADGAITTTARPPRRLVLRPDDLTEKHSQRRISLAPWKAELTTLLTLWRRLLGFGVAVPGLPAAGSVVECAVTFPLLPHEAGRVPHFVVAFFDGPPVRHGEPIRLPGAIQDDEEGLQDDAARAFRGAGVHLVTTFRYVTDKRTATFWLRGDVVAEVVRQKAWHVGLCRTDMWGPITESFSPAHEAVQSPGAWTR